MSDHTPKNRKKTIEDYHALAEARGWQWLGAEAVRTGVKTSWICDKGHHIQTTYNTIQQGGGCIYCAGILRKQPKDYMLIAEERGFQWLGPEVSNNRLVTKWKCSLGHEWQAAYTNIQKGRGCPKCKGIKLGDDKKHSPEYYHQVASERNIKWLGPEVKSTKLKTWWECEQGHRWETTFGSILAEKGCHYCAGNLSKSTDEYNRLAEQKGYFWIGPEVNSVKEKTVWRCQFGHEWATTWSSLQKAGCPYCSNVADKVAEDYMDLAESLSFIWLGPMPTRTTIKTNWQCQFGHIFSRCFLSLKNWGNCKVCEKNRQTKLKRFSPEVYHATAQSKGIEWLGPEVKTCITKTWWACTKGHQWRAAQHHIIKGKGCPICNKIADKTAGDYVELAKAKGIFWIGQFPKTVNHKTTWQCKDGHIWETTFTLVRNGYGCPLCIDMVNGSKVSRPQRELHRMLGGVLNLPLGRHRIDVAIERKGIKIAVEYDCWYWHNNKTDRDQRKNAKLIEYGWKVLRIKTDNTMPDLETIEAHIERLLDGDTYTEIIMPDWGKD